MITQMLVGIGCIVFGIFALLEALDGGGKQKKDSPRVGDIYAQDIEGKSADPAAPANPFVVIFTLEEIRDGKAFCRCHSVETDGTHTGFVMWKELPDLRFFRKIGHRELPHLDLSKEAPARVETLPAPMFRIPPDMDVPPAFRMPPAEERKAVPQEDVLPNGFVVWRCGKCGLRPCGCLIS